MPYQFFFRPFILFVVLTCFSHLIAVAQLSVDSNQQLSECEECLTKKDYLLAIVAWRAELVRTHFDELRENELFTLLTYHLVSDLHRFPNKDSLELILDSILIDSPVKYSSATFNGFMSRNPSYYVEKAEKKDPDAKQLHDSLRLRETLNAFHDIGPLAYQFLIEPEWPLKLNLKAMPLHQELERYQLRKDDIVADVGTGFGVIPRILGRVGVHCYANELHLLGWADYLDRMRFNLPDSLAKRLTVVHGNRKDAKLPAHSVDVILLRKVFHHMSKPTAMLTSIKPALNPGGRVIVVEHYLDYYEKTEYPGPLYACKKIQAYQTHVNAFVEAGFKLVRQEVLPTRMILTEWVLEE